MNVIFILFIWNIFFDFLIIVVFFYRNVDFDFYWCFNVKNIYVLVFFVVFKVLVGFDMFKFVGFLLEIIIIFVWIWRLFIIVECFKIVEIFCKEI